jgi:glutathione-specific gamma-glutamylcyclotransferase
MANTRLKSKTLTAEMVALCERPSPKLGPEPGLTYMSVGEHGELAARLLDEAGKDLWVFAYGSLLWRPAFEIAESRRASAPGWQRAFCLEIPRWRGSPEQPGLMMALRQGGTCDAMVQRIGGADRHAELVKLLRREIDVLEDVASLRFIAAETPHGPVRALACWAEPVESRFFTDKPIAMQAHMLARACGSTGSGAAYLYHTLEALAALGISDDYLNDLASLVAKEIAMHHGLEDA